MPRDRHGRVRRADGDPRRRPVDGFRTGDRHRFRRLVQDALGDLPEPAVAALAHATLEILEVPRTDTGEVALADAEAAGARVRRLSVYRRPAELRAGDREDLVDLVRDAVLEAVADAVGADPEDWEEA